MGEAIKHHRDGGVARIILSRVENRNVLSVEMVEALNRALEAAAADPATRVVILAAEGPAFCAGMDLKTVALDDPQQANAFARALAEAYRRLLLLPIPLLAAVEGPAMGGAVGLALAADVVFAGPEAKFAFPETRVGVVPALVSVIARRRVAPRRLCSLTMTGRELSAEEAVAFGFADHLAHPSALAQAEAFARRLISQNSAEAMARTKRFLQSQFETTLEDELAAAIQEFKSAVATEACHRGLAAFRSKQKIDWTT
jgi:methylglutaconyl-CoA hydratase